MGLTFAQAETAAAALDAFLAQEGVTPQGRDSGDMNGFPTARARFVARTQQGSLAGTVMFAEYGGAVYQIIGYGPEASWSARRGAVETSMSSFAPLRERRYLDVSPHRIDIVTIPNDMTAGEFLTRYPSSVPDEEVLLANQVNAEARLTRGQLFKRVTGGRVPTS